MKTQKMTLDEFVAMGELARILICHKYKIILQEILLQDNVRSDCQKLYKEVCNELLEDCVNNTVSHKDSVTFKLLYEHAMMLELNNSTQNHAEDVVNTRKCVLPVNEVLSNYLKETTK